MRRKLVKTGKPRVFEGGKATKRFDRLADELLKKRASLYRKLAKHG